MQKPFFAIFFIFLILLPGAFAQVSLFSLNLSKTAYAPNKSLAGDILVQFSDPADKDAFIEINLNGNIQKLSLGEILAKIPLPYNATEKRTELLNFSSELNFEFDSKGQKNFGLELPKLSTIKNIDFKVEGLEKNTFYPKSIKLDFGEANYPGVEYFGPRIGWSDKVYTGKGLNLLSTNVGILQLTKDDIAKNFCEVISIPKTKHVVMNARYKLKENLSDYLNLSAGLYSYDGLMLIGTDTCQLPNPTISMAWLNCEISHQQFVFEGDYYACLTVESAAEGSHYESNFESSGNVSSSYYCYGLGGCQSGYPNDYFITLNTGVYDAALRGEMSISNWTTVSPQYLGFQIERYLESCKPYDETKTKCLIPIALETESPGKVKVKGLHLLYESGGLSAETNSFADIKLTPAKILSIENKALANYSLHIPLGIFNKLKTPQAAGTYTLIVNSSFGKTAEKNVDVIENLSYAKPVIEEVLDLIEDATDVLESQDPQLTDVLILFGVDKTTLLSTLNTKKQSLQTILASTAEDEKKKEDAEVVLQEIDALLAAVPKTVVGLSKIIDSFVFTSPQEIPDEIATAADKEAVYQYQERVDVLYEIKEIIVVSFLDEKTEGTLIKKTVKAKTDLDNVEIFEVIPKSAASDVTKVKFAENPVVVQNDPIVKWNINQLAANAHKDITYFVLGKHLSQANAFLTAVISNTTLPSQAPPAVCGDEVCSVGFEDRQSCPQDCKQKLPLLLLSIILSILVVAVFFILFFKKMKVFVLGNPFESPKDFENVKNYIRSALEKKVEEEMIKSALLTKGWTNQQIMYAFKAVQEELGKKEGEKKISELKTFVESKRKEGLKDKEIKKLALKKGWKNDIVKKTLREKLESLKNSEPKKDL